MLARADADLALPPGVREVLVVESVNGQVLRRIDHAGAGGEGEPGPIGAAQIGGHGGLQHIGLDGLGDIPIHQINEIADVDGHQHIGRGTLPLGGDALGHAILEEDGVDLDAARLGEGLQQGLDEAGLAGGVEADLLLLRAGPGRCPEQKTANNEKVS